MVVSRGPTIGPAITGERSLPNAEFRTSKLKEWAKLGSARVYLNDRNWVFSAAGLTTAYAHLRTFGR